MLKQVFLFLLIIFSGIAINLLLPQDDNVVEKFLLAFDDSGEEIGSWYNSHKVEKKSSNQTFLPNGVFSSFLHVEKRRIGDFLLLFSNIRTAHLPCYLLFHSLLFYD